MAMIRISNKITTTNIKIYNCFVEEWYIDQSHKTVRLSVIKETAKSVRKTV